MSIIRSLMQALRPGSSRRRYAGAAMPEEGMHVWPSGVMLVKADAAELALSSGAHHTVRLFSQDGGIAVVTECSPTAQGPRLRSEVSFTLVQAERAQSLFGATVASWHAALQPTAQRSSARHGGLLFAFGVLCGAALLTVFGMAMTVPQGSPVATAPITPMGSPMGSPLGQGATPGVVAANPTPPAVARAAQAPAAAQLEEARRQLQQARLGEQELQRVAKAHRLDLRAGNKPLVAFSDPNCPACRDLEREVAAMGPTTGFTVIPVGFQPGSRVLAARVLCAPDPAAAWAQAIKGVIPPSQPCEQGLNKVDENNDLFTSIGASATPTLVAGNGQMAQGAAPAVQLEAFAAAYARMSDAVLDELPTDD